MAGYLGTKAVLLSTTAADVIGNAEIGGDLTVGGNFTSTGIDDNASATAMTLDASGNVGIGTSSPSAVLHVDVGSTTDNLSGVLVESTNTGSTSSPDLTLYKNSSSPADDDVVGGLWFYGNNSNSQQVLYSGILGYSSDVTDETEDGELVFVTTRDGSVATEAMRIDSSGNLLVGTTDSTLFNNSGGSAVGHNLMADGSYYGAVNGNLCAVYNRQSSDGDIVQFRKDGTTVGSIGASGTISYIVLGPCGLRGNGTTNSLLPADSSGAADDNAVDLGRFDFRFDDIYATNGTIQTSDRNEKQDIDVLSDAEQRVAVACKGLLRKFRWKDAVAEKGDDARIHFGIIAQDLQDAFTAEGLDAGHYAMFISSTWWETQTDVPAVEAVEAVEATYGEDGNELTPAVEAVEAKEAYTRTDTYETLEEAPEGATERTRLGVRYPELLAFIIGAM